MRRSTTGPAAALRGSRGFTLVEVLVAMAILTAGMLSILALFTSSVAIHREALDANHVERIVDDVIAALRAEAESGRDPEGFPERESALYPAYAVSAEVEPVAGVGAAPGAFLVRVTVSFARHGKKTSETLDAIVVKDDFASRVRGVPGSGGGQKPNPNPKR